MFGVKKSSLSLPFYKSGDVVKDINAIKQHVAWIEFSPHGEIITANPLRFRASITASSAARSTANPPATSPFGKLWRLANRLPAFLSASINNISAST